MRIVSGGQTGVDRAALDVARELSVPSGGWCPKGRRAEDGVIDPCYPLIETPSEEYPQRTEWNVRDADGTLILYCGRLEGGSALTRAIAKRLKKPCLAVDLAHRPSVKTVLEWLDGSGIRVLNVAGPRESQQPGISAQAVAFLREVLRAWNDHGRPVRSSSG